MKNLRVTIWLLLAFAFSAGTLTLQSCGSRKKRVPSTKIATITPEKVEITGELKEYVEIVTGSYEITTEPWGDKDEYNAFVSIKIKGKKAMSEAALKNKIPKITITMLDDKGNAISNIGEFHLFSYGVDPKLMDILKSGKGEESIKFQVNTGGYNPEKDADKTKKFTAFSKLEDKPEEIKSETSSNTPSENDDNISTTDCTTFAKEYGEFVDAYIVIYKKYMKDPSNVSVLSDYTDMLEKMNKMTGQKERKDCSNDATYNNEILKHTLRLTNGLAKD